MIDLFRNESSDAKHNAQLNLAGRTRYVDDDTLRYFRARILSTRVVDDGLLFAMVESASGDMNHTTRIFRYVIFDIFGTVIERPDIEASWKSSPPAEKAMWRALNTINAVKVTREAIKRHRARQEYEITEMLGKVDAIVRKREAA